jgi:prevent-host-death family protein
VKQLSATDAARQFSDVLDKVEAKGESFVVVRRGRAVATIAPANGGTGRAVKDLLRTHAPDSGWAGELAELREAVGPAPDHWRD